MNIVIPMAGTGERFLQHGVKIPKMLINVAGKPMLYWALDSLSAHIPLDQAVFVCLHEHVEQYPVAQTIRRYCDSARLVVLREKSLGQAHSVLLAESAITMDEPIIIFNCDTVLRTDKLPHQMIGKDGYLSVFSSIKPQYSYIETDSAGTVVRVTEKKVISPFASTGLYQFNRADLFVRAAEDAILHGRKVKGEYYIAPLYMDLITQGYQFGVHMANECYPLGSPEELQYFLKHVEREGE